MISSFENLAKQQEPLAGGKGRTLARLYRAGYPVPDGFIILPAAFAGDDLTKEAWSLVLTHLDRLRKGDQDGAFAVRSSALNEDSSLASFAGEFETVLDVRTDDEIRKAIHIVHCSQHSARVQAYRQTQGLEKTEHEMAVVVQHLVRAELSGVLFTADPVTGNLMQGGNHSACRYLAARKETDARYRVLPPFPSIISGRFDPFQWAADPNRRGDVYDMQFPGSPPDSNLITGFAGGAGLVEGVVRRIDQMEDSHLLQPGEILVTITTNVGWTPLFPRAAAVVTDVGAPLSHAAIVARELGIPAVVGCNDATMRLKTGDRVRVNGSQGTVEILKLHGG